MGNHQDSARELAQRLIQCLLGVQIQMVGGLVQGISILDLRSIIMANLELARSPPDSDPTFL